MPRNINHLALTSLTPKQDPDHFLQINVHVVTDKKSDRFSCGPKYTRYMDVQDKYYRLSILIFCDLVCSLNRNITRSEEPHTYCT